VDEPWWIVDADQYDLHWPVDDSEPMESDRTAARIVGLGIQTPNNRFQFETASLYELVY